jgi:hypothetical protein
MKLLGSKKAKIQCLECGEVSEPFRIWLYEAEGESLFNLNEDDLPKDWEIVDEAELDGDLVCGYCPTHREQG